MSGDTSRSAKKPIWKSGTFWIFVGLVLGVVVGGLCPEKDHPNAFHSFQLMSKGFIALIKGIIVPILVSTIIVGVAQTGDLKAVGRMGGKALLYFEVVTTLALGLGLLVANVLAPGKGLPIDLTVHGAVDKAKAQSGWETAMHLFPSNLAKHAVE